MTASPLTVADAIESRRSIRRYTDAAVPDADLRRIVELAGRAPSAWNVQPWRVIAVRDQAVKDKLKAAAYNQAQVGAAPVVFVVTSDMADMLAHVEEIAHPGMPQAMRDGMIGQVRGVFGENPHRETWGTGQTYIFVGFLLLAAQSLGYATSPMLGFDAGQVKQILGLPDHVQVPALIAMGRPGEDGFPAHRHAVERILKVV
jgi:nitroreductase